MKGLGQMGMIVLDDEIVDEGSAGLSFTSPGFAYAACVFEGICIYKKVDGTLCLFRLDDHLRRLEASMLALGFEGRPDIYTLRKRVLKAVKISQIDSDGHIRLMAYVDGDTTIGSRGPVRTAIVVRAVQDRPSDRRGVRCHISTWRRPADTAMPARIKCTANYAVGRLATLEAERAGADTPILLSNEGAVSESATANFFALRGGVLCTPRICDGILEGITRNTIIRLWNESGRSPVQERRIDRSELVDCEAIFLCGSLWEITSVLSIDNAIFNSDHVDITWLKEKYHDTVRDIGSNLFWCSGIDQI